MNEPIVVESVTNECQSLGRAHESSSARAEQLIACLEDEIAKRDEELAACRVAVENCEVFRARIAEFEAKYLELASLSSRISVELPIAYALPVSEAKAQGVVMPDQEGSDAQIAFWAGFEFAVCGLHNNDIRAAWNDFKSSERFKRLNAAPVQQVSVPQCVLDWFEAKQAHVTAVDAYNARLAFVREHMPFGTSVDPEYQIMEAADRKARSLVGPMFSGLRDLAAAPEAPAADAWIVDMYRHLQKVTPYRFKKIQDASITDGGDVMYFHKDRFDAALLADMAAHCAAKGVV